LLVIGAPLFASAHSDNNAAERQHIFNLLTDWVVRSSLPLVMFLLVFGGDVLELYGPDFAHKGTVALRILVGAQFFSLISGPVGNVAMMSGLEWQAVRLWVIVTILLAVALAVLTPIMGLIGVALASGLAAVFGNMSLMALVRKKLDVRWWDHRYSDWLPQCGATLAATSIALFLPTPLNATRLITCLAVMYGATLGATFVQGWHEDDKLLLRHVQQAVRARLRP
jgi:O-antigen/teichoic acid export membrane protein